MVCININYTHSRCIYALCTDFRKHKNTRALNNTPRDRVTAKLYVDNHGKKYEKNMGNEQMRLRFH